jgi:hypothetical protein
MDLPDTHAHGPGGPRPVEHFHSLPKARTLRRQGDSLSHVSDSTTGSKGDTAGETGDDSSGLSKDGSAVTLPDPPPQKASAVSLGPGWVQFAGWQNESGKLLTHYSCVLTVPSPPQEQGKQVIFLFPGLQTGANDGTELYQPVLQWGPSAAGGGLYWSVSCWYAHKGRLVYSSLMRVSENDRLVCTVERVEKNDLGSRWMCTAEDELSGSKTQLPVIGEVVLGWCNTTLEAYSPDISCAQFPNTPSTTFRQISIYSEDTPLIPAWKPTVNYHGCNNEVLIDGPDETRLIYQ